MKVLRLIVIEVMCLVSLLFSSCKGGLFPAATPPPMEVRSLIPGECITNTELFFHSSGHRIESFGLNSQEEKRVFTFEMSVEAEYEILEDGVFGPLEHRYAPTDALYEKYGDKAEDVKYKYERLYHKSKHPGYSIYTMSIVDPDKIIFTADKDYVGIPAGENLAKVSEVDIISEDLTDHVAFPLADMLLVDDATPNPNLEIYKDWALHSIRIIIATKKFAVTSEVVRFNLSIPVRIYNYLDWIYASLTDENAPITWRDEVLTCEFAIGKGTK